ncbi:hypothetical protein ACLOJK_001439 [Asimina triloba]
MDSSPAIDAHFPLRPRLEPLSVSALQRCPPSFSGVGFLFARDRSPFFAPLLSATLPAFLLRRRLPLRPPSFSRNLQYVPLLLLINSPPPIFFLHPPPPMGRKNSGTTTVAQHSSSIALLEERFRKLQRVKEMREEREQLRLFAEPDEIGPTNRCEPSSLLSMLFFHPKLIRLSIRH